MLRALAELTAAAGLEHPQDFHPEDFSLRVSEREMMTVGELHPTPVNGELLIGARSIRPFASSGTWRAAPVLRSRCNGWDRASSSGLERMASGECRTGGRISPFAPPTRYRSLPTAQ
jgi:hypothetical protein